MGVWLTLKTSRFGPRRVRRMDDNIVVLLAVHVNSADISGRASVERRMCVRGLGTCRDSNQ